MRPTPMPHTAWIASTTSMLCGTQPNAIGRPLIGATMNHSTRAAITPRSRPESQPGISSFGSTKP